MFTKKAIVLYGPAKLEKSALLKALSFSVLQKQVLRIKEPLPPGPMRALVHQRDYKMVVIDDEREHTYKDLNSLSRMLCFQYMLLILVTEYEPTEDQINRSRSLSFIKV